MLQNISKTIGFQKIMVYKTPPGGGGGGGKSYLTRGLIGLNTNLIIKFHIIHQFSILCVSGSDSKLRAYKCHFLTFWNSLNSY